MTDSIHYRPPHHLVLLRVMWWHVGREHEPDKWYQWLDQITHESPSLFNTSTLKCVDDWLSKLPSETPDGKWLPYINFYPKSWRTICTSLFASQWKRAQTKIWPIATAAATHQEAEQSTSSDVYDSSTTVDIRTWNLTLLMSIFQNIHRVPLGRRRWTMEDFMRILGRKLIKDFLQSLPALPVVELVMDRSGSVRFSAKFGKPRTEP